MAAGDGSTMVIGAQDMKGRTGLTSHGANFSGAANQASSALMSRPPEYASIESS
jgi:hypothetical protein